MTDIDKLLVDELINRKPFHTLECVMHASALNHTRFYEIEATLDVSYFMS